MLIEAFPPARADLKPRSTFPPPAAISFSETSRALSAKARRRESTRPKVRSLRTPRRESMFLRSEVFMRSSVKIRKAFSEVFPKPLSRLMEKRFDSINGRLHEDRNLAVFVSAQAKRN